MPIFDPNEIPGYREAVEAETSSRENSYLDLAGVHENILGVEVRPITPLSFFILDGIRSRFLDGGIPQLTVDQMRVENVRFLWAVSPSFRPISTLGDRWARLKFVRHCRSLPTAETAISIRGFIDDALADAPGSNGAATGRSVFSWIAVLVDLFAREYGWSERQVVNTPLKRLWQYRNIIRRMRDPNAILFNRSDRVISAWLRELNEKSESTVKE